MPVNNKQASLRNGLTGAMLRVIEAPAPLHLKMASGILENAEISFRDNQGYINAKDLQIQCLFEYEKLKTKVAAARRRHPKVGLDLGANHSRAMSKHVQEYSLMNPGKSDQQAAVFAQAQGQNASG